MREAGVAGGQPRETGFSIRQVYYTASDEESVSPSVCVSMRKRRKVAVGN